MASFNSLPLELVAKVIDLAAEDYVALEDETSRCRILSSLALVSTIFTLPAQQALWRYIVLTQSNYSSFITVIRTGFGRDKKVKKLLFELKGEENGKELKLKWFFEVLSGISSIEELDLFTYYGDRVNLPNFFEIASVKGIKGLEFHNTILQSNPETFPTTLRYLTFSDMESAESLLSQLSLDRSAAVDTLEFKLDDDFEISVTQFKGSISYFELHGANLRNLSFESCHRSMIPILLPHTPSLLHLAFLTQYDEPRAGDKYVKYIETLPASARLLSLDIGKFDISNGIKMDFLLPLLVLPQLSHLKLLRTRIYEDGYAEYYEEGRLDEVPNGLAIRTGLDKLVKLCQDRGVRLSFRSEQQENLSTEIRKQKLYSERQKELDRISEVLV